MSDHTSAEQDYTMGYSEEFLQLLHRRSAETHAAHLLPHLKPGLRVLDFGCGPGTISVGLATAVAPGELHGIDMEESQINMARAAARAGGHDNATFHVGDVTDLPFDDDSFDVAHCHAVLMHVPDTEATLAEVKRVLKPGGIISSREFILGSSFLEPGAEETAPAWATFGNLLAANGGHPQMGRELKRTLLEAGFTDVLATASFDFFGQAQDVAFLHAFIMDWFYSPQVIAAATKFGLATQESSSTNGAKALRYGKNTPAQSERSASARPSPPSRSRGVTSQLRDNGAPQRRPGISQTQRLIIPVVWVEEADAAIHLGPIARIVQVVNSALEVERLEDARAALPLRPVLRDVAEVVAMNAQVRI